MSDADLTRGYRAMIQPGALDSLGDDQLLALERAIESERVRRAMPGYAIGLNDVKRYTVADGLDLVLTNGWTMTNSDIRRRQPTHRDGMYYESPPGTIAAIVCVRVNDGR